MKKYWQSVSRKMETIMINKHKDPLHGITLEMILVYLVEKLGWDNLARRIRINCFAKDPSIKSSLRFLRRTPWARKKVEDLYITEIGDIA
jgi:uncharacterized protein (DUF2132 family)